MLGGTGLIGAEIARAFLASGCSVTVLARHAPDAHTAALLGDATVIVGDAADPEALRAALEGADHVVDALGTPHPADSARAPLAQFDAEVPALLGVLETLAARGGVGFTYLSSGGAIYGDVATLPVREDVECRPVSPYGVTKLAAEQYVLMAAHRDGLRARILRVANAYGARQRPGTGQGLVAVCFRAALTGSPITVYGDGLAVRDYVDVRDVAHATVALTAATDEAEVLNVGAGVGHTVRDVVSLVETVTGAPIEVRTEPARDSDVRAVVLDTARLRAAIEWAPRTLEEGVADAWRAWGEWVPAPRGEPPAAST